LRLLIFPPQIASRNFSRKKCPLLSTQVHSSPLLSHSYWLQRSSPKNPCYNRGMKGSLHHGLNRNHNLTLNHNRNLDRSPTGQNFASLQPAPFDRSVPTCRDRIARFQVACLSAAYDPYWCQLVFIRGCNPKLNKTGRFRTKMPGAHYTNQDSYSAPGLEYAKPQLPGVFAPLRLCVKSPRTNLSLASPLIPVARRSSAFTRLRLWNSLLLRGSEPGVCSSLLPGVLSDAFVIQPSSLIRHSSLVIRHSHDLTI
jgi:hypothetical protein